MDWALPKVAKKSELHKIQINQIGGPHIMQMLGLRKTHIRGHTLITLAQKATYLVRKMLIYVLKVVTSN